MHSTLKQNIRYIPVRDDALNFFQLVILTKNIRSSKMKEIKLGIFDDGFTQSISHALYTGCSIILV